MDIEKKTIEPHEAILDALGHIDDKRQAMHDELAAAHPDLEVSSRMIKGGHIECRLEVNAEGMARAAEFERRVNGAQ